MSDIVSTVLQMINTVFAFAGIIITLYGQYYFKEGLLARTLRRGTVVAVVLFAHFALGLSSDLGFISPSPLAGQILELAFTVGLAYLTYGIISDWKTIREH